MIITHIVLVGLLTGASPSDWTIGTATGTSTVTGSGAATAAAAGSSTDRTTVFGIGASIIAAVGTSSSTAVVLATALVATFPAMNVTRTRRLTAAHRTAARLRRLVKQVPLE